MAYSVCRSVGVLLDKIFKLKKIVINAITSINNYYIKKLSEIDMSKYNKILISWVGNSDIDNIQLTSSDNSNNGPLFTIISEKGKNFFSQIHLFIADNENKEREEKIKILETRINEFAKCKMHIFKNVNVSDPNEIYKLMKETLKDISSGNEFYYNLTSGTPTMYAVQLLLSSSQFIGVPLYTIAPKYVKDKRVFRFSSPALLSTIREDVEYTSSIFKADVNKKIYDQIDTKIANSQAPVFILGDTGVGKTWLARYIHYMSNRKNNNFVEVNCSEFTPELIRSELFGYVKGAFTGAEKNKKGYFEEANGGTLFLDEIGEIPIDLQSYLLSVFNDPHKQVFNRVGEATKTSVNVRIIAATNKNIKEEIAKGKFRQDLYYRLAMYAPVLKSFKEYSTDDKKRLLDFLINDINQKNNYVPPRRLSRKAEELILYANWPGNIRDIRYRLEAISLLVDDIIDEDDIKEQIDTEQLFQDNVYDVINRYGIPNNIDESIDKIQKNWISRAINECNGNKKDAAQRLGINYQTFISRIKKFGLNDFRESKE